MKFTPGRGKPLPYRRIKSKQDGWEPGAGRFVVKADGHQRHGLDDAQAVGEAPAKKRRVTRRQENAGTAVRLNRSNQRLQIKVRLRGGMAVKSERRCVSGDASG